MGIADNPFRQRGSDFPGRRATSWNSRRLAQSATLRAARRGVNEYSGMSAAQPMRRSWLTIASLPLDSKAQV
ncbi:MAG: hypothetical protein ABSF14_15990 [Terriglobia bacterium]